MAKSSDATQPEAKLIEVLKAAESGQHMGYELLSKRKEQRAVRRRAVAERLAGTLAADDPALAMANLRSAKASETAAALRQRVDRLRQQPTLGDRDWMVSGNVRHANGRAGAGLIIQVYDKDLKYDDLLGTTKTNEYGDFYVIYDTRQFDDEWGNEKPDLYVRVLDEAGAVIIERTTPLRVDAGRSEYFEIVIPAGAGP